MENIDKIASRHLGNRSSGSEQYDKSLLVPIPRVENRLRYDIKAEKLPFSGYDVWHAYEFSAMTVNGLPVTRLLKLRYSSDSEFIVESKSLKLYLNSFNMTKIGRNIQETLSKSKEIIETDLSEALNTKVEVNFIENSSKIRPIFSKYINIVSLVDEEKLEISDFTEAPSLLKYDYTNEEIEYFLTFDSLRSNCRVTHQPDFGDAFIYYKSKKHILEDSLIKYLVSFRKENHFHEECVEMIYKRLYDLIGTEDRLFVCALYTRRGGIDICPARWSKNFTPEEVDILIDLGVLARYGVKQ